MTEVFKKERNKGFSLVELIIVIAIMAVLVAIVAPSFLNKIERAREAYDITTMRQAADAATELLYSGINKDNAAEYGLTWWGPPNANAAGAYDPTSGKFYATRQALPENVKHYGKGTTQDGKTTLVMGNPTGAYLSTADYTDAVLMVSIYPNANPSYALVYWKNNYDKNATYVGGQASTNVPKYSIKIILQ